MNILLKLVADLTRMLVELAIQLCLMLMGLLVRLIYWTVRTYGWGKVASFVVLAGVGYWLFTQGFGWLALIPLGLGALLPPLVNQWRGRRELGVPRNPRMGRGQTQSDGFSRLEELIAPAPETFPSTQGQSISDEGLLSQAWERTRQRGGSPGPDGLSIEKIALNAPTVIKKLSHDLKTGRYRPSKARVVEIPKKSGGTRQLVILSVLDRIVQQAILLLLVPLWDPKLASCSYGYRPDRSAKQAHNAVEKALKQGLVWVVDADIKSFFDTVPHAALFALLKEWLPDAWLRQLVQLCVSAAGIFQGRGLAQGAPLSPLLANLYLHRFDEALLGMGYTVVRYADDFVVLCATKAQAEQALGTVRRLLQELELNLNADKTRIVHCDEGFNFLGYTFTGSGKRPSQEAIESIRERLAATPDETTRQQMLTGWKGYFGEVEGLEPSAQNPISARPQIPRQGGNLSTDPSDVRLYRRLFVGRDDLYARHWQSQNRVGYVPVRQALGDADLRAHLRGEVILGTYPLHPAGLTNALILDIDGPDTTVEGQQRALEVSRRLVMALYRQGVQPLWLDSGGKGCHVWFCFDQPVPAGQVRQPIGRWLDSFRPFPEGVMVEVFPKQDRLAAEALGSLIRLPLGRHPETGRWSCLLDAQGLPVGDPWEVLASSPLHSPQTLIQALSHERPAAPPPPAPLAPMLAGCTLLQTLVDKATAQQDLRHVERLALLYTLGHGGEAGRNYIHQVMAQCSDYSPQVTGRWVARLEDGHRAIRCATLKEWLKDHLPGVECACPASANASPVDWLRPQAKYRSRPPQAKPEATARGDWNALADDIFGEQVAQAKPEPQAAADDPQTNVQDEALEDFFGDDLDPREEG